MRGIVVLMAAGLGIAGCAVGGGTNGEPLPAVAVAADGYPTGRETPEGAACNLARAFINRDAALFERTCLKPYGSGKARARYEAFLTRTAAAIRSESTRPEPSSAGPKGIARVFAARHLSQSGPASYAFAAHGFRDVMFVDVGTVRHDGTKYLNRTLVVRDEAGEWYVHPLPDCDPLLSAGLNDEDESRSDFRDVYRVRE